MSNQAITTATDANAAPDAPADELLTDREVSAITKIPTGTLASRRSRGGGPPFVQLGPRTPRYSRTALMAWIAARAVRP